MYYTIYNFRICRHYTDTEQVIGWRDYNHLQGWKELGIDSDYDYYLPSRGQQRTKEQKLTPQKKVLL